jgi:hypothetical protein
MARAVWTVEFHLEFENWANELAQGDREALLAAVRILQAEGPTLGRPLVDTVSGSRHANMKELRPGSTGRTEIRVLFAFDRARSAILLVGGDKSIHWKSWYTTNVPIADDRLDAHQRSLEGRGSKESTRSHGVTQGKGRKRK